MDGAQNCEFECFEPSERVRRFLAISERSTRLPKKLNALVMAFWLGFLDDNELNEVTAFDYNDKSGFDSEEHNLRGFWPWEEEVVDELFEGCQSILVAAAGGGREAIALARKGFDVAAFDSSERLTEACRKFVAQTELKITVLNALPDQVPDSLGVYDALLVGRGAYHHIPGRQNRIDFLRSCKDHLAPGSPVFLDDFHTLPEIQVRDRVRNHVAKIARSIRRLERKIEMGDQLNAENFFHRFQHEEIAAELDASGYELMSISETPWEGANLAYAVARVASQSKNNAP